ncbi:shikimate dehydrogenase [Filimonas lacunae]|uniref:Shikimate dehydrogenase n=1 Tax=Filimonas lacunae TaxID=477680 RepID=A0A173M9B5_9BACT|nr:shikimate dehydrogenase [Filimonas lacunae]BAV04137.1 shikimate 5-dehydrogenase I alpha [Filimonas lacunae]SIT15080.1 shikimate dehydrogenase [Filimonas lacunae]
MRTFGILGYPLTHSFSQGYFREKFEKEGIADAEFQLFSYPEIASVRDILATEKNLEGFCITIPHKKSILSFLHETSEVVQDMGACNCVRIKEGKLIGYNTDVVGFEQSFAPLLQPHHQQGLILGTGGAAAAVEYILKKRGIAYKFVSRTKTVDNLTYDELSPEVMEAYTVVVNCTPLGTYPNIEQYPDIPYALLTDRHYLYDLVYNPPLTQFLAKGQQQGAAVKNGHDMLLIQAEENWKIWNR